MQQVNVRGISPLAITRMCVMVDATSAIRLSTQSINQPINQMRSSQHRGTPQHRTRRQGDLPQVWRASRIMPVSISGHFGPARARTCNGQENTAQTLPLNVVPPVPGYLLARSRELPWQMLSGLRRTKHCFSASRGHHPPPLLYVCKPPYASMECAPCM